MIYLHALLEGEITFICIYGRPPKFDEKRQMHTRQPEKQRKTGQVLRRTLAVRLMPAADVLGIAEGIETALSAATLDGIPVWAALNTSLLARFQPSQNVTRLLVYVDRDEAGLIAALKLFERLQGRLRVEIRIPQAPHNDWNNVLISRRTSGEGISHE